ncbi:MAG TPA: hypothetical protein PLK34_00425 [Candidatus Pacearchaeota archaeon]|nr:hypothetical protein [Candidatus Pacearchaeota archaeon]
MKNRNNLNKRGELTTDQIVLIVILILSFSVIILFINRVGPDQTADKQICRSSVVLAAQKNLLGTLAQSGINCKTNYLCISFKEDCKGMEASQKEIIGKSYAKQEVLRVIVEELADCWQMYGAGVLNYKSNQGANANTDNYCAACTKIEFDSQIRNAQLSPITYREFYNYLKRVNIPSGTKTYYDYFCYQPVLSNPNAISSEKCIFEVKDPGAEFLDEEMISSYYDSYYIIQGLRDFSTPYEWGVNLFSPGNPALDFMPNLEIYNVNDPEFQNLKCEFITKAA